MKETLEQKNEDYLASNTLLNTMTLLKELQLNTTQAHLQFAPSNANAKNCKRACYITLDKENYG